MIETSRRAVLRLPAVWLRSLLGKDLTNETYFATETVEKTTQAVFPVFFGQADVALVWCEAYGTLCELNPQLVRDLEVLAVSPKLLPTIIYFPSGVDGEKMPTITEGALALHDNPRGRQILRLFGNDRVVRFEESHLAGTTSLIAQYLSGGAVKGRN